MNIKIYNIIKKRILNLEYEPGQRLNQKEIAAELGISQTPVREVFLRLEWERLVSIIPRNGIQVTKIDFKELKEIYWTRILIESELIRLVAKKITNEQLEEMNNLLNVCNNIKGDRIREKLIELNRQFREVLFRVANYKTMQDITELLFDRTIRVWHLTFNEADALSEVQLESKEIENTIESLSSRNPEIAQELRQKIITSWVERLHKYYTRF